MDVFIYIYMNKNNEYKNKIRKIEKHIIKYFMYCKDSVLIMIYFYFEMLDWSIFFFLK